MPQPQPDVSLPSLRGGLNDSDPPNALAEDECTAAMNVEWFYSMLGERRCGTQSVDLTGSGLTGLAAIVHISQWFPTNDISNPETFLVGANPGVGGTVVFTRRAGSGIGSISYSNITIGVDVARADVPNIYEYKSQALNGKLFWTFPVVSAIDRSFVYDGSGNIRLTGLGQPDPPTGANEGAGTYSGTRYFRIRLITKQGTKIVRRSEPSSALTFSPSGSGAGVTLTRNTILNALNTHSNEGQTHWEVEASEDNANFYVIATVPYGTLTYNDETPYATGYTTFPLSEAIGAYLCLPAYKYMAVDEDRLLWGGHWYDPAQSCTVGWTRVANDPGVGNDERNPIVATGGADINSTKILDSAQGGPITGLSNAVNGTWYAFKWSRIYRMTRTGDDANAYDSKLVSPSRGAIPGTVFNATDADGAPIVLFIDPELGPSVVTSAGIQLIKGLQTTFKRINLKAANVIGRGLYYPKKQQALWWLAADGADSPTLGFRLQTSYMKPHPEGGLKRGWSLFNGKYAQALCAALVTEWVIENGITTLSTRPFIGLTSPDFVQRTDVGTTDNSTAYVATLTSRPLLVGGLMQKWGAMVASLLAIANTGASFVVRLIRDFGVETTAGTTVSTTPAGAETTVVRDMDDLRMSEARAIQVQISDS
jgi:hypothetical protein